MSTPSNRMTPEVGLASWRTIDAVVDLPQPDSPTRPTVSCEEMSNDTLSTARSSARRPGRKPPPIVKRLETASTDSIRSDMAPATCRVAGGDVRDRGLLGAPVEPLRAAVRERAADGAVERGRRLALDAAQSP